MSLMELIYTGVYAFGKIILGTISDVVNPELAGDLLVFTVVVILLKLLDKN